MPRFAANLTLLFTEVPPLDRPALADQAGFHGAEVLFPYDHPPQHWASALGALPLVLINTPPGDWAAGDRGFAAVPGQQARFRRAFAQACDYARALGAGRVHVMAGVAHGPEAKACYLDNLAWAAAEAPDLTLLIEPLNPDDMPGYFLNDYDLAARILDDLDAPGVKLQFDLWHAAKLHGDAAAVWARHAARIGHVQIAGFPNRNEPGRGGFDLTALCDWVDAGAGGGWIAAEYRPARATVHGLGWLAALKSRPLLMGV
jgi:2-dehydrotetronate isomerase